MVREDYVNLIILSDMLLDKHRVEGKMILELKSVKELNPNMEAQLLNYLRLSKVSLGYLINFRDARVEWKRRVLSF